MRPIRKRPKKTQTVLSFSIKDLAKPGVKRLSQNLGFFPAGIFYRVNTGIAGFF